MYAEKDIKCYSLRELLKKKCSFNFDFVENRSDLPLPQNLRSESQNFW